MFVAFLMLVELVALLAYKVTKSIKYIKLAATLISFVSSLSLARDFFSTPDLSAVDKVNVNMLVESIHQVSSHTIIRNHTAGTLNDVAFLEVDQNERLHDLFNKISVYEGVPLSDLTTRGGAPSGAPLPVIFVDVEKMNADAQIRSPGPIFVYGKGHARLRLHSKIAIVFGNDAFKGHGSVLDAPLLAISHLGENHGLELRNSYSADGRVKLVPFSQLQALIKDLVIKGIHGTPVRDEEFSLDPVIQEIQVARAEPKASFTSKVQAMASAASEMIKRIKWSFGLFYLRGHIRFSAADLQEYVDKYEKFAEHDVTKGNVSFHLKILRPEIRIEDGKVKASLNLNLSNFKAFGIGPKSGALVPAPARRWSLSSLKQSAKDVVANLIPIQFNVRDIQLEIDELNIDRSTGLVYGDNIRIVDFKLGDRADEASRLESFKPVLLNALEEILPRELRKRPIYDLSKTKMLGFPVARVLLEKIAVDPKTSTLHVQLRLGSKKSYDERVKACIRNLIK